MKKSESAALQAVDPTCLSVRGTDEAVELHGGALCYAGVWEDCGGARQIERYAGIQGPSADLLQLQSPASSHAIDFLGFNDLQRGRVPHRVTRPSRWTPVFRSRAPQACHRESVRAITGEACRQNHLLSSESPRMLLQRTNGNDL